MSIVKSLLPLVLLLTSCWAIKPIFDNVEPQAFQEPLPDYRLPEGILPVAYDILLEPNLNVNDKENRFTFKGESKIIIEVKKEVKTIILHSKGLEFYENKSHLKCKKEVNPKESIKSESTYETIIGIQKHIEHKEKDFIELILEYDGLRPDKTKICQLTLVYTGQLNDKPRGFYRSSYRDQHDNTM